MIRRIVAAVVPLAMLLVATFNDQLFPQIPGFMDFARSLGRYGYNMVVNALEIALPILLVMVAGWMGLRAALREIGILADPIRPLFFALVATSPVWLGFALTAPLNAELSARELILLCWIFPFAEEVFFRGYVFGQLYGRAKLGFWPSALVPAVVFAAGHAYQSQDPATLAGILAITGSGSVIFSYFYVRFGMNIWAPTALHAALNTWWSVFTANENALGGLFENVLRFGSIGLAFALVWAAAHVPLRALVPRESGFARRDAEG